MKTDMTPDKVLEYFRSGARVAAGSTQTHRGDVEISYWANPFPLLKDKEWKVLPQHADCLLYTSPSPRDRQKSRMPSSA